MIFYTQILIDGFEVDPNKHGLPTEIQLTKAGCDAIAILLKGMLLCEGLEKGQASSKMKMDKVWVHPIPSSCAI